MTRDGSARDADTSEESFEIHTLREAQQLAETLSTSFPDPERVVIGLTELLINAVEHGSLGISFHEKAELLERGEYEGELARRAALPALATRRVRVTLRRAPGRVTATIEDDGDGFDWRPYLDPDPERALDANGHGIAIARGVCFDDLAYSGKGNRVEATVWVGATAGR